MTDIQLGKDILPARVAIVDDSEDIREILEDMLAIEGFDVDTYSSSEKALQGAALNPPDLFLLDIRMPGIDGFELCRRLKRDERTSSVPVIFISGLLGIEEKAQGFEAGASDYITKPFHNLDVLIRVRTHIMLRKNALKLERVNEELENKVEERTRELRLAKEAAEEANRSKSDFLANINHEIRTPLNGILGMLKMMGDQTMDEELEMFHSLAEFSARHLGDLITDILDYTQLDSHSMRFRFASCDMADSLEKVCRLHRDRAESKGLTLKWDISPESIPFVTDESRVVQIVSNLIVNAIKYSTRGTVSLFCRKRDDLLEIRVEDEGIGIPENRREDIFRPFTQLESPYTKEHDGMGLGLPISRNIANELGGSLDFSSGSVGSCFILTLKEAGPESPAVGTGEAESNKAEKDASGRTVLVVEDDAINLFLLESLLDAHGWNTIQALNGEEALEELDAETPDLVLLDMGLPRKSGLEVLTWIRERDDMKDLPVLAVTAYSAAEDLARFEASGINGVITKPVSEELLFSEIQRLMNA